MARFITGTVQQLAGKLNVNGKVLDAAEINMMCRLMDGLTFKKVGVVKKEGERGRPATIWQVDTETAAWFECADTNGVEASDTDAPAYVKPVKAPKAAAAA